VDVAVWTGSNWLRIGIGCGHLWMRLWTFEFHKMRGISWLPEKHLASQEGFCSMELVNILLLLLSLSLSLLLFSTYALLPSRLIVRSGLDVPTFPTRRLHARSPSGGRWNCGRKSPVILPKFRLPCCIQESFTCRKVTTWDRRLYFPSEGRRAEDFFALKILRFRPGANPGTKDQHATFRPP
jgi:hypothetical protein